MSYQFQCPFCGASMEAGDLHAESEVQCPACEQSFLVEAPRELVRVQARAVTPAPAPRQPAYGGPPRPSRPPAASQGSRGGKQAMREESRVKVAIVGLLAGGSLLIGGLIWAAGRFQTAAAKSNIPPKPETPPAELALIAAIKAKKEAEARLKLEEAEQDLKIAKANEAWRRQKAIEDDAEARSRRQFIVKGFAREFFDGDMVAAGEAVRELEEAEKEVTGRFSDGILNNEPDDITAEIRKNFMGRILANRTITEWARGRSITDFGRRMMEGGLRGPDGKPVDPNSVMGMLRSGKYRSTGSGFWISKDGWMLTNAHVTGGAATVDLRNAAGKILSARVVKTDTEKDLALLKADGAGPPVWLPITGGEPRIGMKVIAAGFPRPALQGVECKITTGDINSLSGVMDNKDCFQCGVPVFPGNSGGPVLEPASGWAIGVVCSKIEERNRAESSAPVSYAIKASVVRSFVASVPEAKPVLDPKAAPPNVKGFDESVNRARESAALILVR